MIDITVVFIFKIRRLNKTMLLKRSELRTFLSPDLSENKMSDSSVSRKFYPFARQLRENRNEDNENTDYLIQKSIKINVRGLTLITQFEYDPKHCYSFQECND